MVGVPRWRVGPKHSSKVQGSTFPHEGQGGRLRVERRENSVMQPFWWKHRGQKSTRHPQQPNWCNCCFWLWSSSAHGKSCGPSSGSEVLPHKPRRVAHESQFCRCPHQLPIQWHTINCGQRRHPTDCTRCSSRAWVSFVSLERSGQGAGWEACEWARHLIQGRLDEGEGWSSVCRRAMRGSCLPAQQADAARGHDNGRFFRGKALTSGCLFQLEAVGASC